jgi:hypothetical protein
MASRSARSKIVALLARTARKTTAVEILRLPVADGSRSPGLGLTAPGGAALRHGSGDAPGAAGPPLDAADAIHLYARRTTARGPHCSRPSG